MKSFIIRVTPNFILDRVWRLQRSWEHRRNRSKTSEEVFTEIYEKHKWGGADKKFSSGPGSADVQAVSAYISMIYQCASLEKFAGLDFVDLGCGDFTVGKQLRALCSGYVGVDIVKPLVERNQAQYGNAHTRFVHLDIVADDLPDGDVCFVRQVLQHLSNQQIMAVLPKLKKYRWVFITEHYPSASDAIVPNLDKVQGGDVRAYDNSGIYLTEPPFSLPANRLKEMLVVPGVGLKKGYDPGLIRTFLYDSGQTGHIHGRV